jgi:uncharacterized protein YgiM (DUF1202 family)
MFLKKIGAISSMACLVFVSACSLMGAPAETASPSQDATAAMQTQVALMVASTFAAQTVAANVPVPTQTNLATSTPESTLTPSLTPTPSDTLTPTFTNTLTLTNTPTIPMVSVSSLTNCRTGPGTAYDKVGTLIKGETAEVIGRGVNLDYWIIKLPSKPLTTCWLWSNYATVTGNTSGLTIYYPPATPTVQFTATPPATFEVAYFSIETCGGGVWKIKFHLINSGSVTWESNRVTATDQTTSETTSIDQNTFPELVSSSCAIISDPTNLEAGKAGSTSSTAFSANPAGHPFTATIRLCSSDVLLGTCVEKTITFKP